MGGKRVVRHPIIPTHGFLAIILSLIKNTIWTNFGIYYGSRLKSICQDNVRVHGCHVNVVDQRLGSQGPRLRVNFVYKGENLISDLFNNFLKIFKFGFFDPFLNFEIKFQNLRHLLHQVQVPLNRQLKISLDISPINPIINTLDKSSHISLRLDQTPIVKFVNFLVIFVRKNNVVFIGLSH